KADLVEVKGQTAKIALTGSLLGDSLKYLAEQMETVKAKDVKNIVFKMEGLESISREALRYLVFTKQKLGADVSIAISGAAGKVKEAIVESEFMQEITCA